MQTTKFNIDSLYDTGDMMYFTVENYHGDVAFLDNEPLDYCFDFTANLPYIPDPKKYEALSRPAISLSKDAKFRDCDDKAIILGCCLYRRDIPFWFVAVSEDPKEDYHHVLIEIAKPWNDFLNGEKRKIRFLDCTYPENEFGKHNRFYKKKRI